MEGRCDREDFQERRSVVRGKKAIELSVCVAHDLHQCRVRLGQQRQELWGRAHGVFVMGKEQRPESDVSQQHPQGFGAEKEGDHRG